VTPYRFFVVPEVLLVHDIPSEDVSMIPLSPTVTNNPVEVVVELSVLVELVISSSSLLLQEMTVRLKRNKEKIMSIYLTWFTIGGCGNN